MSFTGNSVPMPGTRRWVAPVIGLFFLSPLVAEFLLGNIAIDAIWVLLIIAPLYGGGAVLIREVARWNGRGWPTMMLLALAYAVIEEGWVTQSLFNPSYFGFDLLGPAYMPFLGMGAWWTLYVLTIHMIWSIAVPIALVEPAAHAIEHDDGLRRVLEQCPQPGFTRAQFGSPLEDAAFERQVEFADGILGAFSFRDVEDGSDMVTDRTTI